MQMTSGSAGSLNYCTSLEEVTAETPDISDYLDFEFMTGVGTMITQD